MVDGRNEIVPVENMGIVGQGFGGGPGAGNGVLMGVDHKAARMVAQSLPRNYNSFMDRLLFEARGLKEAAIYSWSVNDKSNTDGGKTAIEGPSVKLAMAAARCYGNCDVMPFVSEETPTSVTVTTVFVDLETGFKVGRMFKQTFNTANYGKMGKDRAMDINFQIAQSKSIRNAIVAAIPESAINEAIQAAKQAMIGPEPAKLLNPKEVDAIVAGFDKIGVTRDQLVRRLGKAAWNATDKANLTIIYKSIQDKQTTVEAEFGDSEVVDAEPADDSNGSDLNFSGEVEPSARTRGK